MRGIAPTIVVIMMIFDIPKRIIEYMTVVETELMSLKKPAMNSVTVSVPIRPAFCIFSYKSGSSKA